MKQPDEREHTTVILEIRLSLLFLNPELENQLHTGRGCGQGHRDNPTCTVRNHFTKTFRFRRERDTGHTGCFRCLS